jgi:hypothetical protein
MEPGLQPRFAIAQFPLTKPLMVISLQTLEKWI